MHAPTPDAPRCRVVVYYPSFAHWGGAEKLALLTAASLAADYDVVLSAEDIPSRSAVTAHFGTDLAGVELRPLSPGGPISSALRRSHSGMRRWQHALMRWSHGRELAQLDADLLISVEPSPPIRCRHQVGIYSCFFPFGDETEAAGRAPPARAYHLACRCLERLLLGDPAQARDSWGTVVACSPYTAEWIERLWGRGAAVVPPPCDDMGPPAAKEPWVLSVGRFQPPSRTTPTKSFDALIAAFRLLCERTEGRVELHLAGHAADDAASRAYLEELRGAAAGLPVVFHPSIPYGELRELYRKATLFWLATGYRTDAAQHPGKQEHFGIVTVEAMSAGAVPLLYASGGSVDIIGGHGVGALWKTPEELVAASLDLLHDPSALAAQSRRCTELARGYSPDEFARRTRDIVAGVLSGTAAVAPQP